MEKRSIGMIETLGYVPAIEAADAGTKAADVTLVGYERARGGLITVKFLGDVGAVKTSVSAGKAAAMKVGTVVAVHVIPRPDRQLHIEPGEPPPPHGEKRAGEVVETPQDVESHEAEAPQEPPSPPKAEEAKKSSGSRSAVRGKKAKGKRKGKTT